MNEIDRIVGGRIRALRLASEMTQGDLADRVGVKFQQIQKYEKGTNRVSASRLVMIASVLKAPVAAFFEGAVPPDASSGHADDGDETCTRDALSSYALLDGSQKKAVLAVIRAMVR